MKPQLDHWYQIRDKRIVKAGNARDGAARLEDISGKFVAWIHAENGREMPPSYSDCRCDLIREVSDPTKPLQLRVGGKYLDREGIDRVLELTPPHDRWAQTHPFKSVGDQFTYRLDGKTVAFGKTDMPRDLICEILDQPEPELELVLEAVREYECDNGDKAIAVGIDPFNRTRKVMIVAFAKRSPWCYELNGVPTFRDSYPRIIRPWIDPPTEFVDPRNGKRYQVGPEIKEAAK